MTANNDAALNADQQSSAKDVALPDMRGAFEAWFKSLTDKDDPVWSSDAFNAGWQAALLTRQAVPEWMHISTAPKDGTPILVWDGSNQTTAKWCVDYQWWEICVPSDGYVESNCISPTHWMRLPNNLAVQSKEGE